MLPPIELQEPLISAEELQARVAALADEIHADYADSRLPLSVIVVLKGACFFAIDLLKTAGLAMPHGFFAGVVVQRHGLDGGSAAAQRHHPAGGGNRRLVDRRHRGHGTHRVVAGATSREPSPGLGPALHLARQTVRTPDRGHDRLHRISRCRKHSSWATVWTTTKGIAISPLFTPRARPNSSAATKSSRTI